MMSEAPARRFAAARPWLELLLCLCGVFVVSACNPSFDTEGDNCSISCEGTGICPAGLQCSPHNFCTGNGSDNACVSSAADANRADANRSDAALPVDATPPADAASDAMPAPLVFTQLSAGLQHTCGVTDAGDLLCWGSNQSGQLGFFDQNNVGSTQPHPDPQSINVAGVGPHGGTGILWTQVSAGTSHTCAVTTAHTMYCWGDNSNNEVDGNTADAAVPEPPTPLQNIITSNGQVSWTSVAAGNGFNCAIGFTDGDAGKITQVFCWGRSDWSQTGGAGGESQSKPVQIDGLTVSDVPTQVTAGDRHACALTQQKQVYCWGANQTLSGNPAGQADPTNTGMFSIATATPIKDSSGDIVGNFTAVAAGNESTCALQQDNQIDCWGFDGNANTGFGLLGGGMADQTIPGVQILPNPRNSGGSIESGNWTAVVVGHDSGCGLFNPMTGGTQVACWGTNQGGNLGTFTSPTTSSGAVAASSPAPFKPVVGANAPSDFTPSQLTIGDFFACTYDGAKYQSCWGRNDRGQLGQAIIQREPAEISETAEVPVALAAGTDHTCALLGNAAVEQQVYCWGLNDHGQVSESLPLDFFSYHVAKPSQALRGVGGPVFNQVALLSAGSHHSCLKSTESNNQNLIACWGNDDELQLPPSASNNTQGVATYAEAPNFADVSKITAMVSGGDFNCFNYFNNNQTGRVRCWGNLPNFEQPAMTFGQPGALDGNNGASTPLQNMGIADGAVWGTKPMTIGANPVIAYWGDPQMPGNSASSTTNLSFLSAFTSQFAAIRTAQGSAPHRCVADGGGELWCGGLNDSGQIPGSTTTGAGVTVNLTATSTMYPGLKTAFFPQMDTSTPTIAVGAHHTCAITGAGDALYCFGDDTFGQLGIHDNNFQVQFPDNTNNLSPQWVAVVAGARHTCAAVRVMSTSYQIYCWGAGDFGQLGSDFNDNEPSFQRLPTLLP